MNKKVIVTISTAAAICALAAFASGCGDKNAKKFTYIENSDGYTVTGLQDESLTEIVIPSEYNDKPVTRIATGAFTGTNITSVTIPESIQTIEMRAFYSCDSLTSATIEGGTWIWSTTIDTSSMSTIVKNAYLLRVLPSTNYYTKNYSSYTLYYGFCEFSSDNAEAAQQLSGEYSGKYGGVELTRYNGN